MQELEYPDVPSTDYNQRAAPADADEVNERSLPAHSKTEAEAHCAMLEVCTYDRPWLLFPYLCLRLSVHGCTCLCRGRC